MDINKLYKGSKNPPALTPILLKTINGKWGMGKMFIWHDKRVYFNYDSPEQLLRGEPKSSFVGWIPFPDE